MSWETAKRAIDRMGDAPFTLQFAGGEPTMNMELVDRAAKYARNNGCRRISMQTNGTCIDEAAIACVKRHGIAVGVSLDGQSSINDALRGKTCRAIEGIKRLGASGVMVNLNAVVSDRNVEQLPQLVDLAAYLGNVHGVGLDLLREAGRAAESGCVLHAAGEEQIAEALRAMHARTRTLNRVLPRPIVLREIEEARARLRAGKRAGHYCYASQGRAFAVLPDGEVYPCGSLIGRPEFAMGNVHSGVNAIAIQCRRPEKCRTCGYEAVCPGACPSRSLLNGGFSAQDCALKITAFRIAKEEKEEN